MEAVFHFNSLTVSKRGIFLGTNDFDTYENTTVRYDILVNWKTAYRVFHTLVINSFRVGITSQVELLYYSSNRLVFTEKFEAIVEFICDAVVSI
jgi:hypothetical protein